MNGQTTGIWLSGVFRAAIVIKQAWSNLYAFIKQSSLIMDTKSANYTYIESSLIVWGGISSVFKMTIEFPFILLNLKGSNEDQRFV